MPLSHTKARAGLTDTPWSSLPRFLARLQPPLWPLPPSLALDLSSVPRTIEITVKIREIYSAWGNVMQRGVEMPVDPRFQCLCYMCAGRDSERYISRAMMLCDWIGNRPHGSSRRYCMNGHLHPFTTLIIKSWKGNRSDEHNPPPRIPWFSMHMSRQLV